LYQSVRRSGRQSGHVRRTEVFSPRPLADRTFATSRGARPFSRSLLFALIACPGWSFPTPSLPQTGVRNAPCAGRTGTAVMNLTARSQSACRARCSFEGDPPLGSANQRSSGEQPDATAATERKTRQALSIPWEDRAHSCWWPRCVAHTQCTLVAFRELLHAHPCADPWTFRAASSTAARMRR
jgi:hypothetical protein